jgi:hypothetical protein
MSFNEREDSYDVPKAQKRRSKKRNEPEIKLREHEHEQQSEENSVEKEKEREKLKFKYHGDIMETGKYKPTREEENKSDRKGKKREKRTTFEQKKSLTLKYG